MLLKQYSNIQRLHGIIALFIGWLVPLLSRISENTSNVLVPVIDNVKADTFNYDAFISKDYQAGGFQWNLIFNWHNTPPKDAEHLRKNEPTRYFCSPRPRTIIWHYGTFIVCFVLFFQLVVLSMF